MATSEYHRRSLALSPRSSRDPSSEPSLASDRTRAERTSEVLKALAHPLRISIVALLCDAPLHVGGLADALHVNQAIVSQQLRVLRAQRLVAVDRTGGRAVYRIEEPRLYQLVDCMNHCRL